MILAKIKQHRTRSRWYEGIFRKNPIFVCGLALPFAVMVTNNLKNCAAVSILMACALIPSVLLASLIGTRLRLWGTGLLCALLSLCVIVSALPLVQMISPEIIGSLGVYIPILSVNTLLLFLAGRHTKKQHKPLLALADALSYSTGFALAMGLIGGMRELLGNNALWGIPVAFPVKLSGLQIAFSGFLAAALLSALFRFVRRGLLSLSYRRHNTHSEEVTQA